MSKKKDTIPITNWNSPIHGDQSEGVDTEEAFDDGGFEEYWEQMELLDLDETEIPLDQLECGSDREDFGSSVKSYLNELSPVRDGGQEGKDYAALLQEVTDHLEKGSQNRADDSNYEDEEEEDYDDADYDDDYEEESGMHPGGGAAAVGTADDNDDMFDDYEEDVRNSKLVRAMSREAERADNVRLEASHETYSSEGDADGEDVADEAEEFAEIVASHSGHNLNAPTTDSRANESYADDYEEEEEDDGIEFDAPPVHQASPQKAHAHVHAGYGIAPNGALAGNLGQTGLFSPSKLKEMLAGGDDDEDEDAEYEEVSRERSSHSRSKTIDRSAVASHYDDDQGNEQPDSRGAEVIFSANTYGDDGANPVFTYKDFEFLPPAEEDEAHDKRKKVKVVNKKQHNAKPPQRGGRKIVVNQGPAAPPKVTKAGPYAQAKLGAPPGVQRRKKGQPLDPAQARKNRENRERHMMMLEMIALKRKEQEDEAIRQLMKEEAKRKRFKEALLEKAMRSRQIDTPSSDRERDAPTQPNSDKKEKATHRDRDGSTGRQRLSTRPSDPNITPEEVHHRVKPSLLEPTKAFEAHKMPARKKEEEVFDEEERAQKEEDNYEKVAQLRRKFKEQHKQILLNMLVKKKEADKKKEEEEKLEAHRALIKKMKRDERLAKRAAENEAKPPLEKKVESEPLSEAPAVKVPRKIKRRVETESAFVTEPTPTENGQGTFGTTTASTGSGVPLMRSRSQGTSKDDLNAAQTADEPKQLRRRRPNAGDNADDAVDAEKGGRRAKSAAVSTTKAPVEDGGKVRMRRTRSRTDVDNPAAVGKKETTGAIGNDNDLQRNLEALDEMADDAATKKQKRAAALSAKEKIDAQLQAIANQRKQAAEEEKKNQERMRRRVEKLAKRIVQEAHEGKKDGSDAEAPDSTEPSKPKSKKVTPEMAEAMVARLQAKVQKTADGIAMMSNASVPARDFVDWKRKHNVPLEGLVFSMTGWYPCVKEALLQRGWTFNSDPMSPYFDLKWTLRSSDIGLESLQPWQLTNHFLKNVAITTKAGLIKSLQQLVWQADMSPDDIIPRAYDLTNVSELHAFVTDFRLQKAEGLLKGVYAKIIGSNDKLTRTDRPTTSTRPELMGATASVDSSNDAVVCGENADSGDDSPDAVQVDSDRPSTGSDRPSPRPFTARVLYETPVALPECRGKSPADVLVNKAVFESCCAVLERFLRPQEDSYIDTKEEDDDDIPMTPLEWELLSCHNIYAASKNGLPDTPPELLGPFGRDISTDDAASEDPVKAQKHQAAQHRNKRRQRKTEAVLRSAATSAVTEMVPVGQAGFERIHNILYRLHALSFSQSALNGSGENSKNIWIVKPAAKSRGRGISTFVDLDKLLQYCDVAQKGQGSGSGGATMWIVQKYMENPMVIASRKFDLRQWVLVTDWNPLTIYFFDEAYCRFSSEEYTTSEDSLENSFVHLVNQSVNKNNSDKKGHVFSAENGEDINGFMWSCEQFKKYLAYKNNGVDVWTEKMQPRMKEIAKVTLGCAVDMIEHRKNSWELYGFDFMVDDENNVWLIEVNSSPACDYSTSTTERYVQKALVELLSVTLDLRKWEATPRKERGERPETGGWECIYKGPMLETPASSFGADMTLKGAGIKLPRRAQPSNNVSSINFTANSLERDSSSVDNKNSTQVPRRGLTGGKALRRQVSGVENTPNASGHSRSSGEDDDSDTIQDNASKPRDRNVTKKTSYDPSNLARSCRNLNDQCKPVKDTKSENLDFDDSSGDEETGEKNIEYTFGSRKHKGTTHSKKSIVNETPAVAVPVKVFSVDF